MIIARKILLYLKGSNIAYLLAFFDTYENLVIRKLSDEIILIETEELDLEMLEGVREFALAELYTDIITFTFPKEFEIKLELIKNVLPKLNPKLYTIETFIPEIIFLNQTELVSRIKNYYYSKFNSETIETVLGFINENMNATKTAKVLYMHRNTLNYRLDNFINKTEIDVRSFIGALAIYLLFRR